MGAPRGSCEVWRPPQGLCVRGSPQGAMCEVGEPLERLFCPKGLLQLRKAVGTLQGQSWALSPPNWGAGRGLAKHPLTLGGFGGVPSLSAQLRASLAIICSQHV